MCEMSLMMKSVCGLAGALVVLGVLAYVAWPSTVNPCRPLAYEPSLRAIKVDNVVAPDGSVVANMAGYVHFIEHNTYLPLQITAVHHEPPKSNNSLGEIELAAECIRFRIQYERTENVQHLGPAGGLRTNPISYKNFDLLHTDASKLDYELKPNCFFTPAFNVEVGSLERFSCRDTQHHECGYIANNVYNPRVDLVLRSFELELPHNKMLASAGRFSLFPKENSCSVWH